MLPPINNPNWQAFPALTTAEIERVRPYGTRRHQAFHTSNAVWLGSRIDSAPIVLQSIHPRF